MVTDGILCFVFVNSTVYIGCMKNIALLLLLLAQFSVAQDDTTNPNRVYEKFSEAYATLDADILLDCYTEDGTLLNLYDGSNPNSIKSAAKIREYFAGFFQRIAGSGKSLELVFKITHRERVGNTIYDNGYYKLSTLADDMVESSGYGKLSTILELVDDSWRFRVDSNTNTDKMEFERAKTGSITQPKN